MNDSKQNQGTPILLKVGQQTVSAVLNDRTAAKDLLSKLPMSVSVSRAHVDYCGVLPVSLEHKSEESQRGWRNGDISYIPGADWIAFFFGGEAQSASDPNPQHIVGKADHAAAFEAWPQGSIEVRIEIETRTTSE